MTAQSAAWRLMAIGLASLFALPAGALDPPGQTSPAQSLPPQTQEPKPPVITSVAPVVAPRGAAITLVGTLPADAVFWIPPETPGVESPQTYDCRKNPAEIRTRLVASSPQTNNGNTTFSVLIPASLALGNYTLCASFTVGNSTQWYTVPILGGSGRLQVVDSTGAVPVEVTSVPRVVYEASGRYKFSVLGNGFSRIGADNAVLLNGVELAVCWGENPKCVKSNSVATGSVTSTHQLVLDLPESFQYTHVGSQKVQVRVGSSNVNDSDNAPSVTLARIDRDTPRHVALGVLVFLILIVALILGTNRSDHSIEGHKLSLLATLLLDKATNTYSLSRAQFYAWTSAAVFGYTYLTVAWTFLQGRLEFAPVPENLPGIIVASAGTAAIVEGISGGRPKGSGTIKPELADFISTGGMVVPDRLQFLVWTVVGVLTFLLLIVSSDPATIATLPSIPTDFLALMGISSAGYLGGRLARKGGPVIDDIRADIGSMHLEIHGRCLSKSASFQIDGEDVTLNEIGGGSNAENLPKVIAKDDSAQDPNVGKAIAFTILSPKPEWLTRKSHSSDDKRSHTLTIINPDGQKSDGKFSIAGPTALISMTSSGKQVPVNDTLQVTRNDTVTFDASASKAEVGALTFKWFVNGVVDELIKDSKLTKVFPAGPLPLGPLPGEPLPGGPLAAGQNHITVEVTDAKKQSDTRTVTVVIK